MDCTSLQTEMHFGKQCTLWTTVRTLNQLTPDSSAALNFDPTYSSCSHFKSILAVHLDGFSNQRSKPPLFILALSTYSPFPFVDLSKVPLPCLTTLFLLPQTTLVGIIHQVSHLLILSAPQSTNEELHGGQS
ncbi:hypothetical protein L1887_24886 [Cichorium endivia]|nr:hypothetical protein L1887_24886 [Cichorium endivia]